MSRASWRVEFVKVKCPERLKGAKVRLGALRMKNTPADSAALNLLAAPFSAERLALLYEKLTGKKPTAEEVEEMRAILAVEAVPPPEMKPASVKENPSP